MTSVSIADENQYTHVTHWKLAGRNLPKEETVCTVVCENGFPTESFVRIYHTRSMI